MSAYDVAEAFLDALSGEERELYDRAPCGFVLTSADGTITKANSTFLEWLGMSREELIGQRRFSELLNIGGQIYYETHYAPTLQMQGHIREIALDFIRADGSRLHALVNSVLDKQATGDPVIRTVVFDATERRRYEQALLVAKEQAEASESAARALAQTLQQTLIPPSIPKIDGLDVAAAYRPAGVDHEIGGDFYDVFKAADDEWVVAVGDVCGKGVEAAVVTSAARYAIRAAAMEHDELEKVLRVLNGVLLAHEAHRFCTVGIVRLRRDGDRWKAKIASAGHPPAILRSRAGTTCEIDVSGTVAGVLDAPSYRSDEIELAPGSTLFLYTDGVTEGRQGNEFYGEARLHEAITRNQGSAELQINALLRELVEFQIEQPRDDIAIVAIRVPE